MPIAWYWPNHLTSYIKTILHTMLVQLSDSVVGFIKSLVFGVTIDYIYRVSVYIIYGVTETYEINCIENAII